MKATIITSASLFLGFGFVYTAHLDYKKRNQKNCYKPTLYSINGQFSYPILPILSNELQDDIFLSLVFPAYNEEKRLGPTLDNTINYFSSLKINYEIIIVNGGSTDNTLQLVTQKMEEYFSKNSNLIDIICASYTDNGGKGWAVKTGVNICRGNYILMLDSDGSTNIEEFESLYNSIKDEPYAIAIGSRRINIDENNEENVERVWYRNLLSNINYFIVKKCIGISDIEDTQCGFKLFTRQAAFDIFNNLHIVKWAFDVDMLYICNKLGIKIKEIPVRWKEMPGSKLNIISASISFVRDYIAMILFYKTGFWKVNNYSFREINIV